MRSALDLIKSSTPLYILHLSSGHAQIYFAKSKGATRVNLPSGLQQASDLTLFAKSWPNVPWVILVDQSEEVFWGGVMPIMRGAAKTAWIERMSAQSGMDSPYRWSELQGKSSSQPDKLRVLGYTVGRHEELTPWLEALLNCNARIRGVYSHAMLTTAALKLLKIKPLKKEGQIAVLVTPHADGIRQSVLVAGKIRFSRLALHPFTNSADWFATIYNETGKLREYLVSSGLLKNDRAGMQFYVVLPTSVDSTTNSPSANLHAKDSYRWLESPLDDLVYVAALASKQPSNQLAPTFYSKRDLSLRITRIVYAITAAVVAGAIGYAGYSIAQLWQKQLDMDAAQVASNDAAKQYQAIAKNFPPTPLTALQLIDMSKRWDTVKAAAVPNIRDIFVIVGQILNQHPSMAIEKMDWIGEVPAKPIAAPPAPAAPTPASKEKKEISTLVLSGKIRGVASDDLRGTRDALSALMLDINKHPNLRAEVTQKPLDLSTKATLTGSGKQESSDLQFEIKLWQR